MKKVDKNLVVIVVTLLLILISIFMINQRLMCRAIKKNEMLFSDNQLDQARIIADAITREVHGLTTTGSMIAGSIVSWNNNQVVQAVSINQFRAQIQEHDVIDGYALFDRSGRKEVEIYRSDEIANKISKVVESFGRLKWFEVSKLNSVPYLTHTHVNSREQLLIMVYPVRNKSKLSGTLVQVINLKPLINLYIAPLRYGKTCAGFLLSSKGVIIYDDEEEIIGKNIFQGLHNEYPKLLELDRRLVLEKSGKSEYSFPMVRNGEPVRKLISWHAAQIGSQKYVVCIAVPDSEIVGTITESRYIHVLSFGLVVSIFMLSAYIIIRRRAARKIQRLSLAVESSPSAVIITDPDGLIKYVNKRFEKITGYTFQEVRDRNPSELVKSNVNSKELYDDLWTTITSGKSWRGELINKTKSGEEYWCRLSISSVINEFGKVVNYVGIQEDLTELKKKEEELRRLATIDDLTEINNRRNFIDLAQREIDRVSRHGCCTTLAILDIDHFKNVNDTYGHDFGDFVLKDLSSLVSAILREVDVVGRIGGEEFALMLPQTDYTGAKVLLERLRTAIENHNFIFGGITIQITASFGFTVFKKGSSATLDELMKQADRGLYMAKNQGRNRFVFSGDASPEPGTFTC